jgi:hypothetical protein
MVETDLEIKSNQLQLKHLLQKFMVCLCPKEKSLPIKAGLLGMHGEMGLLRVLSSDNPQPGNQPATGISIPAVRFFPRLRRNHLTLIECEGCRGFKKQI